MRVDREGLVGTSGSVSPVPVVAGSGGGSDGSVLQLETMVDALCGLDLDCGDAVRIDRIVALERVQAAA